MHFLHLGKFSGQKSNLENLPSAFCAFGKMFAVEKVGLVNFRVCRILDLVNFHQVREIELGEVPGPDRPSAGELATGRGLTFGPPAGELATGRGLTFGRGALYVKLALALAIADSTS